MCVFVTFREQEFFFDILTTKYLYKKMCVITQVNSVYFSLNNVIQQILGFDKGSILDVLLKNKLHCKEEKHNIM